MLPPNRNRLITFGESLDMWNMRSNERVTNRANWHARLLRY